MKKTKTIFIVAIILILVVLIFTVYLIKNNAEVGYKNTLSINDTFDRFIALVESSEYEEAKKLTTKTFNADLSTIKDIKISKKQKDYELSNEKKYVYVDTYEIGYYKMVTKYNFELEQTKQGWKISNFYDEITNNEDEINSLIY